MLLTLSCTTDYSYRLPGLASYTDAEDLNEDLYVCADICLLTPNEFL